MDRRRKTFIIIIISLIIFAIAVPVISMLIPKEKENLNVKTVKAVPGCEFDIDKLTSDTSTAVMEISKNINFLDYETYTFRNGEDLFLLFNMKKFIVITKKGTNFNLSKTSAEDSLKNQSLQGIWFTPTSKVTKKGDKFSVNVSAQVVITNTLYNDFHGTLTTIEKNGMEWSMFTGYVNSEDEKSISIVDTSRTSFIVTNEAEIAMADFEVNIEDGVKTEITTEEVAEEEPSETDSDHQQSSDEASEEIKEEISETTEEASNTLTAKSTQKKIRQDDSTAYSSSIYAMLPIEGIGYMDIVNEDSGQLEAAFVKVTKHYNQEETIRLLQDYKDATGNDTFVKMEIPTGCHVEAVEYATRYTSSTLSFVDARLLGVDGETLRFRGMPYDHKTYDITKSITVSNDWYSGNTVFYIVPDGCYEYALQFCGIFQSEEIRPAWFYLNTR